jgi:hypothetical protein
MVGCKFVSMYDLLLNDVCQQFFQDLNLDIDLETAKKLMKEADADNSGTINVQGTILL